MSVFLRFGDFMQKRFDGFGRLDSLFQPILRFIPVNLDFRSLCVIDLLGGRVEMRRVPAIAGGQRVVGGDGTIGVFFDVQEQDRIVSVLSVWRVP